jgi:methylmalonyl-CoA carboxyltransferase large subunit
MSEILEGPGVSRCEFEALEQQVRELKAQIASLMSVGSSAVESGISDDVMIAIAAAVAAYLGKKATIKFIRSGNGGSVAWQNYGRASISGSHALSRTRAW